MNNTVSKQLTNADSSGQVDSNPIMTNCTEKYTYDDLNRLSIVDYGDGETQSYGLDALGNRLTETDNSTSKTGCGYAVANRLLFTTGAGASTYASETDGCGRSAPQQHRGLRHHQLRLRQHHSHPRGAQERGNESRSYKS